MPQLEMWVRGKLCGVYAFFEPGGPGVASEWLIEDVQPLDGTPLDIATLTDGEWHGIHNALWDEMSEPENHTTWTWFIMHERGPWWEGEAPLNTIISRAHREWRGYWL